VNWQSAANIILLAPLMLSAVSAQADSILPASETPASPDGAPVFVQTFVISDAETTERRQFFGRVNALETVDLSFEVGGRLERLDAPEGARIEQGRLMAALDPAPFKRAVERAEIALQQSERELARARTLANRNVASDVRAEDAQTTRDLAEVALREARDALEDAQIAAPFDALVADRIASSFTTVQAGQPIIRVHNMSEVRVAFDLPERIFALIGDPKAVRFSARLAERKEPIPLEYREFKAETGAIGQSYTISLAVTGGAAATLIPGRTVIVQAEVPSADSRPVLPVTAITTRPSGEHIVVAVEEDGGDLLARHIPVKIATSNGSGLAVEGLPENAEVVAVGAHLISDGQRLARYTGLTVDGD